MCKSQANPKSLWKKSQASQVTLPPNFKQVVKSSHKILHSKTYVGVVPKNPPEKSKLPRKMQRTFTSLKMKPHFCDTLS